MNDKKQVFCKGCKWIKDIGFHMGDYICKHKSTENKLDPVTGDPVGITNCRDKNKNCDCPDYEERIEITEIT